MSNYLPYEAEGLFELVNKYGFNRIKRDCKIYVGKTGPADEVERFVPEKLSDLMPLYSHPVFYVKMSNPAGRNAVRPLELWISSKSYAEIAREEGKPLDEFEKIESSLAIAIAVQREKESTELESDCADARPPRVSRRPRPSNSNKS